MLIQYILLAIRRLLQNPVYSLVNILVLSIGLASAILVFLYVKDELSFDKHWSGGDSIFRLGTVEKIADGSGRSEFKDTFIAVAPKLSALPQIENASRYVLMRFLVAYGDRGFYEDIRFADAAFFDIYNVKFVEGNSGTAFDESYSVVLSESTAKKYFGDESALGKVVQFDVKHRFTVGGVIEDSRYNTHLKFDLIANIKSREQMYGENANNNWGVPFATTYVKLAAGESEKSVQEAMKSFSKDHVPQHLNLDFTLLPVADIHVEESAVAGQGNLAVLSVTALLILLMACINTVNLNTAKGVERNKELGVRKALGASRLQLALQILSESIILSFAALIVALLIVELMLGVFNNITDKSLSFDYLGNVILMGQLVFIAFITGLMSGAYPAFILSSFKPVEVFRGNSKFGTGSFNIRKLLLIAQFAVAVALSIFSIVIYQQLQFMKNMDLGFDSGGVVIIHNVDWTDIKGKNNSLKAELLRHPDIRVVAESTSVPSKDNRSNFAAFFPLGKSLEQAVSINRMSIGFNFFEAYDIQIAAGRNFSESYGSDRISFGEDAAQATFSAIINESAAEKFGWSSAQDAIGKIIRSSDPKWPFSLSIVGVVKDFHMLAGHGELQPYVFVADSVGARFMSVKLSGSDISGAVDYIDEVWAKINPQYPIVRSFLDSELEAAFSRWEKNGQIMGVLVFVTIIISVIGSFSLAAFSIRLRNKEICLRKLVGASAVDITKRFIWDFSKPILWANAIAIPVGFYFANNWLNEFTYRISLTPVIFLFVGIASLILCWVSVSFNTIKVSNTRLAHTLKHL